MCSTGLEEKVLKMGMGVEGEHRQSLSWEGCLPCPCAPRGRSESHGHSSSQETCKALQLLGG